MIAVRDLTQYEEFLQVRDVQQQIWGFTQGEGLYPPLLNTAVENGGVAIGMQPPHPRRPTWSSTASG